MDENTIILLIAAGLGLYLWYKNQSSSTTTSATTPATGLFPTLSPAFARHGRTASGMSAGQLHTTRAKTGPDFP